MAQNDRERLFELEIRASLPELKRLGYIPMYFIRMMNDRGAAQAIRDLINSSNESEGFTRLWEMGHLELSAEAIVADQPEWNDLFTDEQRQKARRRLEAVGYRFRHEELTASGTHTPSGRSNVQLPSATLPTGDARLKALAEVTLRPHQSEFRDALRRRYGDACQITGCAVMAVVQACHLVSVSQLGTDDAENGLLLRVDLHVLFDIDHIAVDPETMSIHVSPQLAQTEYSQYHGKLLRVGSTPPNRAALQARWETFAAVCGNAAARPRPQ